MYGKDCTCPSIQDIYGIKDKFHTKIVKFIYEQEYL